MNALDRIIENYKESQDNIKKDEARKIIQKTKETKKDELKNKKALNPKDIKKIIKSSKSAYEYACDVLEGRFEQGEEAISRDAQYSYLYACNILKDRFEQGEEVISKDDYFSYLYALDVIKSRFEMGEEAISKSSHFSCLYACDVLKINNKG